MGNLLRLLAILVSFQHLAAKVTEYGAQPGFPISRSQPTCRFIQNHPKVPNQRGLPDLAAW